MNDNFIISTKVSGCVVCHKDTRFVELNFEAYLHPGGCNDVMCEAYWKAVGGGDNIQ